MSDNELIGELIGELSAFGAFSIHKFDTGKWHANVKFPAPAGVTAECGSKYDHRTPIDALQCVKDRLGGLRTMMDIKSPVPGITHKEL